MTTKKEQIARKETGITMLRLGIVLSPSILLLIFRMAEGFDGAVLDGFGPTEGMFVPLYLIPVLASIILIIKGLQRIYEKPITKAQAQAKAKQRANSEPPALKTYLLVVWIIIGVFAILFVLPLINLIVFFLLIMPVTILLLSLALSNVIFLTYQLIKNRPSAALTIASLLTIIISVLFPFWAIPNLIAWINL